MGIESLLAKLEAKKVTSVTDAMTSGVTPKRAPTLGCTAVTPVTSDSSIGKSSDKINDTPSVTNAPAPVTASEVAMIRAWLVYIDEDDPAIIIEVLAAAKSDPVDKARLLAHIRQELRLVAYEDDRRYCNQCMNLTVNGRCLAATRSELRTSFTYKPILDLPHRCVGYLPKPDDPDQRIGRQRWPGLASS